MLDSVFVSLVFPEVIHFSLPPEARGPRGWGYFPRHSAFVIVRCYYSFCPLCLLVFNGKKETLFFVCFLEATGPVLYYKFCDRQLIVRLMFSISSFSKQVICEMFSFYSINITYCYVSEDSLYNN